MAYEIRINPIDLEPDVAVGIDLPMVKGGAVFKLNYTTLDQALANAKNLLLTNKGERIMQPEFGCDLRRSLFENIGDELSSAIENTIQSNFQFWLPYIFINKLEVTSDLDNNVVNISMVISLVANRFDTRSIQIQLTNTTS